MKTVAFFNNKGGVGKTSLAYHLAYMFAERGLSTLAVDLDPQANLSSMFLDEERLEALWKVGEGERLTIFGGIEDLLNGTGDVKPPHVEEVDPNLGLIVGDLSLSGAEDELSGQWARCVDRDIRAFRVISAFWRAIEGAAVARAAEIVLIDVGPNLGAINRAALLAAQHVVIPMAPDLFSLQGLNNLGPTLHKWRNGWKRRLTERPNQVISLPEGAMQPVGYVILQHAVRSSRSVRAYQKWIDRIPGTYRTAVLSQEIAEGSPPAAADLHCLAMLRHFRSLMPMAMEARKPMFRLKPADGAIGAHVAAVLDCHREFLALARKIAERAGIESHRLMNESHRS